MKTLLSVEVECGEKKCVVGKRKCRFLVQSNVRDKLYCNLFKQHIWNTRVIFQGDYLVRCDECFAAEIKEKK